MKNILFRVNSSYEIGIGHIMRVLVLANQYPNDNIIFACEDLNGNINEKIVEQGYHIEVINSNDIEEINNIIIKNNIDMIVLDIYTVNYKFEKKLKDTHKNLIILSLDDTYQKHYCDILLNHNIGANKEKYKNLVPVKCEIRCGEKYTLIRDEFIIEKNILDVLVMMGGSDASNLNIKILNILEKFSNLRVCIITTKANKNIEKLQAYTYNNPLIKLFINSNKIAQLMKNSDFIICTNYMNIPIIAIKTSSNQRNLYQFLKDNNYLVLDNFDENKLIKNIEKMIIKCKK